MITIHTNAADKATGEKMIVAGKEVTVIDTVALDGLEKGITYDEYGNVYMVVDSELKGRIQAAVMDMIANFEIVVI